MDSDSSDSDVGQNNHNLRFNAKQTEAVVKCVEWVLNVISKKAAGSKKHVKKPIRKEKKAKPKKSEVADVQTHIRALCDMFKSIAFSSRCPQVDVPGPSIHSEAIPGPSKHSEAVAGSSKHSEAVAGSSKHSEAVPGPSRHREEITESSRHSEAIPGTSKQSDALPGPSRHCEAIPGSSRHSEAIPRSSKHSKAFPESSRHGEAIPGSSKHSKAVPECSRGSEVVPGPSRHSEAILGSSRHGEAIPGSSKHSEAIPGTSKQSDAVPGPSRHSEVIPRSSKHSKAFPESSRHGEAIPGSSKHSKAVPECSRGSEVVPGPSRHSEAIPGSSRHSEVIPRSSKHNKAVPESSRHGEAIPGFSKHSEAIPGTSKQSDAVPGPSRHSEAIPGSSRHSEVIPRSSKHSKAFPESSRHGEAIPGSSKHSKAVPECSRGSEVVPGPSRHSEAIPGSSRHSKAVPESSRHGEAIPGSSKHSEAIPGTSKHSKAVPESSRHSEAIPGSSKHSNAVPECSRGSEVVATSRHSEEITGNFRPNIKTAPVSLSHGTERVAPETSFKKQSGDITKKRTKTTESFGAGPKTATSSAIEDHGTSENFTNGTSGIPRTHVEVATGSYRTHSENIISEFSGNQTERSELSTSRSDVAEPRTDTKTAPEISGSSTKIMPDTSKYPSTKAQETSSDNHENVAESSKTLKDVVKETSETLPGAHNRTAENLIIVSSGLVLESSRQNMATEMSRTTASQSDVPISGTSRHTEIVAPDIPDSSTKTMPGTSKNPTETGPAIPKTYPDNVVTETSARCVKPEDDISKSRTETTNPIISRNHAEFMVSGTTGSCIADRETASSHTKDHNGTVESRPKAVSENSEKHVIAGPATKTVNSETMPRTTRNDSNVEMHGVSSNKAVIESSESNNIAVEYNSLNRYDEVPPAEGNSQICTKIKVATTESEEINNNIAATKRNTEKRKRTNSIDDGPKRARIHDKCTLCGKSISNEKFAKHYREQHGIHHEIQHNNRNFENKIHDLDKRLHNTNRNKTNNEQNYKVTVDSKKRTAARSSSAPNEDTKQSVANSTLVIITDSAEAKEPEGKKKRTSTRSDSAPNERIEQTSSIIVKEETNHNKVLDTSVIDLTEDDDLGEPEPPTHITVTKCSPKPADDDQTLNDSKFIDPSDDTSLYETSDDNKAKIAQALLLENVKDEKTANNQLDIEVVSDFFSTFSNTEKPSNIESHTIGKQSTEQITKVIDQRDSLKKQNDSEGVASETSRRGIGVIPGSPITNTKMPQCRVCKLGNLLSYIPSSTSKVSVTLSTSKCASDSASVLLPSRHSNTKPSEHLETQNNPANVQNAQIHQPVIMSTHRRPVSPISQARDISRNTENILPCNTNLTPSTSRSAPKQHPSTTTQINTSNFRNTPATSVPEHPGYFTQSYRKKSNTAVQIPFLVDASTRELNINVYTSRSNLASRNRNAQTSTAVNDHISHPQTNSWHRPVEPHNEITERIVQSLAVRTLNSVASLSMPTPILNQRPRDNQRINSTQSSSSFRPSVFPRQQSSLLEQRPRPTQNGRTWHTPVRDHRTDN
ncbi:mucin-5AC-like [Cydia splendana]|uniref:mucin-5AC-like n=1 Tax=Cydia splendana TaxID=1100963 RepID=UPI00300D9E4F